MNAAPAPDGSLLFSSNPSTVDAGLWWRRAGDGESVPMSAGVGEYVDSYLSPDGRRAVSTLVDVRQSLVQIPLQAGGSVEVRRLTDGYTGDLFPIFDASGRRLAFSSSRSGSRGIWLARPDATKPTPLTTGSAIDDRPAFSPRGDQIAFVSGRGGHQGIWVVNADGGPPRFVGEGIAIDTVTWSPDSKRILFSTPGDRLAKLVTMSVDDGRVEPFPAPAPGHAPSWSLTTNRLAYLELEEATESRLSRTTLAIMTGGNRRLYPNDSTLQGFANGYTAWSPDGQRIALVANQANSRATIWICDPDAPDPFHQLIELPVSVRVRGITWTPDGSSVLVAEQESRSDIVLFDLTASAK